ncbi:MAG: arsenic resistance protein [Nitrososphaeraceae archaeon]|nr:arsenic resistance protein [Nitrososphaeraceae archaeon]MDW0171811.1 arsenic resistance protein [Nitrososphaeraceae archaeon]MDW0173315.1 arsenic resistance protein [Nitrososphaeraceae archaeon]MDW0177228.1 arsenic resistance protein [Nitrososphaeraceae archaeon]MDW0181264.1 arsenic resistance protein [Nitrososphaeraceae archaeon]
MTNYDTKILLVLSFSILVSTISGIIFPSLGEFFSPYILVILGLLLFLNLIQLNFQDLISTFKKPKFLFILCIMKVLVIPVTMYLITNQIYPKYALSVLLLSGISTGLGAPFVTNYVGGRLSIVVAMVIVTSLVVPFILPALVYILYNTEFSIPVFDMILLLVISLIVPLIGSGIIKKYLPTIATSINKSSLSISIILMALINLAIFSKFSDYFYLEFTFVTTTTVIAFALFAVFAITGYLIMNLNNRGTSMKYKISGLIAISYVNNILVTVFAQQFFGSQVAALAAFYNMPYYIGIIFLKILYSKILKTKNNE